MLDLELANDVLLTKVINHRTLLRQVAKLKNIDVYDKKGICRFCKYVCSKRNLSAHDPFCVYAIAHKMSRHNKDLMELSFKRKKVLLKRMMGNATWKEQIMLWLIDWLHDFNPKRCRLALIKFLELNGFVVYAPESKNG